MARACVALGQPWQVVMGMTPAQIEVVVVEAERQRGRNMIAALNIACAAQGSKEANELAVSEINRLISLTHGPAS